MYITYETSQYDWDEKKGRYIKHNQPNKIVPDGLSKPEFMPTKLVRISDMKLVYSSQVNEGYCALSYSWNQSGDMVLDKTAAKYRRVDEGKHKIVFCKHIDPKKIVYDGEIKFVHDLIDEDRMDKVKRLKKIRNVLEILDDQYSHLINDMKYVKFEGIIQKICQEFNIKYIWLDQMCINQDDKEEKKREIRNMHHIYSHAYATVALVPEFTEYLSESEEYFKRLWTLEEAIKSKRLLFVGKSIHRWGENFVRYSSIHELISPTSNLMVSQILYYAHQRTSTKNHDRVFALLNLFPEFIDQKDDHHRIKKWIRRRFFEVFSTKKYIGKKINVDYDQPLEELMILFYGLLAEKDISILLFEKITKNYNSTHIQKYTFLPSWTGIHGQHLLENVSTPFQNYNIIGKTIHLTSAYFTNNNQHIDDKPFTLRKEDLPPPPDNINGGSGNPRNYYLCLLIQLPGTSKEKRIQITHHSYHYIFKMDNDSLDEISKELQQLPKFMDIKMENLCWCHSRSDEYRMATRFNFNNLTQDIRLNDLSEQYVILSDISFKLDNISTLYPMINKKQGETHYKAIGCCEIKYGHQFFSDCSLPKQTFLIQ
ncbi:hypothetical protein BDA99DRAFT_102132 [Phascolomyces articulosus]|uniref:Heterokaryon incompatibility domain-containing protein n=1 Tax=Phascolomyces articulosus TaxID=60185 RepID=A0AAD5PCU7_9FUNG|nr:hypothetical protein BDA99DRAFT_102132 [Phascolomyces articulosus]